MLIEVQVVMELEKLEKKDGDIQKRPRLIIVKNMTDDSLISLDIINLVIYDLKMTDDSLICKLSKNDR